MSRKRTKYTLEERVNAVHQVIDEGYSKKSVAKEYGVDRSTITNWIRKFKVDGMDGLKVTSTKKRYHSTLKLNAVQDYLSGEYSLNDVCLKYNISDSSVLRVWIKKYTKGETNKSSSKGRSTLNKGRKTTYEERVKIAQYTIAHEKNYQQAADHYQVSYQQVYGWVQKYLTGGEEALEDRRGKSPETKSDHLLTEEERLQLRIKELEKLNAHQAAEIGLLKKLEEIKRRWK